MAPASPPDPGARLEDPLPIWAVNLNTNGPEPFFLITHTPDTDRHAQHGRPWGVAAGATAPGPTKLVGPHPINNIPQATAKIADLQPATPEAQSPDANPIAYAYSSARRLHAPVRLP